MAAKAADDTTAADGCESTDDEVAGASIAEASDDQQPDAPGPRRWARSAKRITAVAVFVAALAGAGYEGWLLFAQHQRQVAAHQALDAAQQFAEKFTNADPDTIDKSIDAVTDGSTGEFKDRYVRSISQLRAMLMEHKVTTRGTVVRSAIESVAGNKVQVLLFVKESFTSAALPEPKPDSPPGPKPGSPHEPSTDVIGMVITMEKVGGRWLVAKVVPGNQL